MRRRIWSSRGRPGRNHHPRADTRTLEYLIRLSAKHQIHPTEFFNAFVHAWKKGKARCRGLTIELRTREKGQCVFIITDGQNVAAQFPIREKILREPNPLNRFDNLYEIKHHIPSTKHTRTPNNGQMPIKDLKVGMKGVSLKAQVTAISKPKLVLTRLNEYALFANATLSDNNSTIKVPLWNRRIQSVSVNDRVQIDNANVAVFRGEKQLRIGRNGKLKVVESNSSQAAESTIQCVAK